MEYRNLGASGLKVSVLGLGTNAFGSRADRDTSVRIIHQALDLGINFLDTANIYSNTKSEEIIGEALVERRHEAVVATKAGIARGDGPNDGGASRVHLTRELHESLRRLRTDYVDLYQIHRFDEGTPLEETLRTLDDFVRQGKVRYIGASNYAAWQLMKALAISEREHLTRFVAVQPGYSLADRTVEAELVPLCLDQGVGLIPYFPLAGGILTGKYTSVDNPPPGSRLETQPGFARRLTEDRLELGRQVAAIAERLGTTPGAVSLAWLYQKPSVATVIAGATKSQQTEENMKSVDLVLDHDVLTELDAISESFKFRQPIA